MVLTNENSRLTRLNQPLSLRGDREGRIGPLWESTIGVQVHIVFAVVYGTIEQRLRGLLIP